MGAYNGDFQTRAALEALGVQCGGDDVLVHTSVVIIDPERLSIGNHTRIDPFCVLTAPGGIKLGSRVHVASHCSLVGGSGIEVGDFCGISHGARIFSVSDNMAGDSMPGPTLPPSVQSVIEAPVTIKRHAVVCAGCVVLPGVTIGEGAVLGALSFLREDVPEWQIWAGSPARFIRTRRRDLLKLESLIKP
jgi:carbonic anhydrase/acetyltransferase-like protein (isoleucine patch superfamily)